MTPRDPEKPSRDAPLVVHVIHRLAMGGLENGLVNIINNMPPGRYRHAVIAMTDVTEFRERIRRPDVQCYALNKRQGKDLMVFVRLWKLLRALRPAVVHTRNMATIEGQVPAWLAGVKHRVHGEHGWDVGDLRGDNRKFLWMRRVLSLWIQRWITLSLHSRSYLVEKVGIAERRIRHICNGVDVERFRRRARGREELPPDYAGEGVLVFGTVGRLELVKDQMNLVRAFIDLLQRVPEYRKQTRLVIVGDGSQREALEQAVADAGVRGNVWFAGARDDVPTLLSALDVFVLPSLAEGISNTILEAMACGLPVVATEVGGNPDLVQSGVTGWLVPAADPAALAAAMETYLADPGRVSSQGLAARSAAENEYSLQAMVNKYLAVYDELTGRG